MYFEFQCFVHDPATLAFVVALFGSLGGCFGALLARATCRPHFAAGYGGPWLENVWIDHFEKLVFDRAPGAPPVCLREVFGEQAFVVATRS